MDLARGRRRRGAAPDRFAEGDELRRRRRRARPPLRSCRRRRRKASRKFPPTTDPLGQRRQARSRPLARLAKHDVVRSHLTGRHRLIAGAQGSRADDPFRLQPLDRGGKIGAGARDMDAVDAKSNSKPGVIFKQQRAVGVPRRTKQRRRDGFRMGLGTRRESDQRTSNRRGLERRGENPGEGGGVSGRETGRDEIERALAGRFARSGAWAAIETGDAHVADHCGQMAVEARFEEWIVGRRLAPRSAARARALDRLNQDRRKSGCRFSPQNPAKFPLVPQREPA